VSEYLESLVGSLLYEGYALYPYTPGATKNATPTPFGIVYPPAYAERAKTTFDHLRVECVLAAKDGATVGATVRFLHAAGERHAAVERRIELEPTAVSELAADRGIGTDFAFEAEQALSGRARLRAELLDVLDGEGRQLVRIRCCVHNTTALDPAEALRCERPDALLVSLLSTHVVLEVDGGRFVSPLERDGIAGAAVAGCENVNTWPVLATPDDTAVLAAPIVLPEHPSLAPESLGNLFDNTEIEEALLLHVQVLSDEEREEIGLQDETVRQMIAKAAATTPEEMISLHGKMTPAGQTDARGGFGSAYQATPPMPTDPGPPEEPGHPNPGEQALKIDGVTFHKGAKVVLRPGVDRDVYDRMLEGRTATIERLYIDYEDGAHVAVTIDDDPGQELFRETGRYLFFKAGELEAISE
jgi:hypothetical protein